MRSARRRGGKRRGAPCTRQVALRCGVRRIRAPQRATMRPDSLASFARALSPCPWGIARWAWRSLRALSLSPGYIVADPVGGATSRMAARVCRSGSSELVWSSVGPPPPVPPKKHHARGVRPLLSEHRRGTLRPIALGLGSFTQVGEDKSRRSRAQRPHQPSACLRFGRASAAGPIVSRGRRHGSRLRVPFLHAVACSHPCGLSAERM